jgi:hypothetical protein
VRDHDGRSVGANTTARSNLASKSCVTTSAAFPTRIVIVELGAWRAPGARSPPSRSAGAVVVRWRSPQRPMPAGFA